MKAKLLIAGSRSFDHYDLFEYYMSLYYCPCDLFEIVSGGARGADSLGERWAKEKGVRVKQFLPDYNSAPNPKQAPLIRNAKMAEYADIALIFWDGKSRGTANMMAELAKLGKSFNVVGLGPEENADGE